MPHVRVAGNGAATAVFRVARMPAGDDHPRLPLGVGRRFGGIGRADERQRDGRAESG